MKTHFVLRHDPTMGFTVYSHYDTKQEAKDAAEELKRLAKDYRLENVTYWVCKGKRK